MNIKRGRQSAFPVCSGNFVYQAVLHADTQGFRISFRTRSGLIERLPASDCTDLRPHPVEGGDVPCGELPLVEILGLTGAGHAGHIQHGAGKSLRGDDAQQADYVPRNLSACAPAQRTSPISTITFSGGGADGG